MLHSRWYGEATGQRRVVGSGGAAGAEVPAEGEARAAAGARPRGPDRDHLRAQDGTALGVPAAGAGLWQRHDVLAAVARLATRRGVAPAPSGAARPVGH